jgi:hypothetical protein
VSGVADGSPIAASVAPPMSVACTTVVETLLKTELVRRAPTGTATIRRADDRKGDPGEQIGHEMAPVRHHALRLNGQP